MDITAMIAEGFAEGVKHVLGRKPAQPDPEPEPQPVALQPQTLTVPGNDDETARLRAENERLQEELARVKTAEAEALAAARQEAAERKIESLKTAFKVTPHVGGMLTDFARTSPEAFEAALPIFEALEPLPQLSGTSGEAIRASVENSGDGVGDELHRIALAKQKDDPKLSYGAAFRLASSENPELANSLLGLGASEQ